MDEPLRYSVSSMNAAPRTSFVALVPGLVASCALAVVASMLGGLLPVVGAPVFGILAGMVLGSSIPQVSEFVRGSGNGRAGGWTGSGGSGLGFASRTILKLAIIVLGASLQLGQIARTGAESLILILGTMTAAFSVAAILASRLEIGFSLASLVAAGTAICGGSAIAAVAPCIDAEDSDISYALSVVFLFNVLAVFIFPPLGLALGLSQRGFGLFAGTAINDTSSVVAAAYTYGVEAGDYATVVKLTRTLMILPVSLAFTLIARSRHRSLQGIAGSLPRFDWRRSFPFFVLGFLGMAVLRTLGLIPDTVAQFLKDAGKFLIVVSMSAIGLKTNLRSLVSAGIKPLVLGLAVWASVTVTSLGIQVLMGTV